MFVEGAFNWNPGLTAAEMRTSPAVLDGSLSCARTDSAEETSITVIHRATIRGRACS